MSVIELTPEQIKAKINELNLQLTKLLILSGEMQEEESERKRLEKEISDLKSRR